MAYLRTVEVTFSMSSTVHVTYLKRHNNITLINLYINAHMRFGLGLGKHQKVRNDNWRFLSMHHLYLSVRFSVCLPVHLSIYLSIYVAPTWSIGHPWNVLFHFSFLNLRQSLGHFKRGISPTQSHYLHTGQHKHRINADRHPCLEWDSNLRSQRSSGRRHFMP
jgi:hypothetical protein